MIISVRIETSDKFDSEVKPTVRKDNIDDIISILNNMKMNAEPSSLQSVSSSALPDEADTAAGQAIPANEEPSGEVDPAS